MVACEHTHCQAIHNGIVRKAIVFIHHGTPAVGGSLDDWEFGRIIDVVIERASDDITDRYYFVKEGNLAL